MCLAPGALTVLQVQGEEPLSFVVGDKVYLGHKPIFGGLKHLLMQSQSTVIRGIDIGVVGMRVGGEYSYPVRF